MRAAAGDWRGGRTGRDEHVADPLLRGAWAAARAGARGGKRRYTEEVFRRLAIIDAAQRVGFTLEEIRDLLGSRDEPAHERLRQLALLKLPELDDLIARATSVRRVLKMCSRCNCDSIDVCRMFDERSCRSATAPPRARRAAPAARVGRRLDFNLG